MTFCHRCGKEILAGASFCPSCGAPVAAAEAGPAAPTYPFQPQVQPIQNLATLGDRAVAVIIDHVILFVISLVFLVPLLLLGALGGLFGLGLFFGPPFLVGLLLWLMYFTYFEGTTGQTPGKSMLRIKTMDEVSQRPLDIGMALVRNVLRIVDWLPFFYIIGVVLVEVDAKKKRLGDMVANSIVIKT